MEAIIESPYTYFNKAVDLVNEDNLTEALAMLSQSLMFDSDDIDTLNLSGLCSYLLCKFEVANSYWLKSLSIEPDNNKALEYLKSIHNENFSHIINIYNEAITDISEGKYLDATTKLKHIVKERNSLIEPNIILGLCYIELKENAMAKQCFERAYELDKGNKRVKDYLHALGDSRVISTKTSNTKWITSIAFAIIMCVILALGYSIKIRQNAEYKKEIKNYIHTSADVLKEKENIELANKKLNAEIKDLKNNLNDISSEKLEPTMKEILTLEDEQDVFNNAVLDFRTQKYELATEGFKRIKQNSITDYLVAEAVYFLAKTYELNGEYDEAINNYNKYITSYKGSNYYDESLYYSGILYYKLGYIDKAKVNLKKLVTEEPKSIYNNDNIRYILNN